MRIAFNILLLSLLVGFITNPANGYAQYKDYLIEEYTIEDGLSQTSINCIMQDSRGFIWIGTQDGLNKFDGYDFQIFKNQPLDHNSISNNYIRSIIEDKNGDLWIGTDGGLNKFDYSEGLFTRYFHESGNSNSIPENEIFNVYQDKFGYIWLKTRNYLSRFEPNTETFRNYEHYNDIFNLLSQNINFSILEDSKGMLWVGTKDGLNYFDRNLEIFKRFKHKPGDPTTISHNRVNAIYEDSKGNLWIGTDGGLNKFDRKDESFHHIRHNSNNPNSLSSNVVNDIVEDSDGVLWVCTNDGINQFNYINEEFRVYKEFTIDYRKVLASSVTSVIQDMSGILWLGTLQGLFKFQKRVKKFEYFSHDEDYNPLFVNNYVYAVFEDDQKRLWVGTWGAGLHIFDRETYQVQNYTKSNSGLVDDYIHAIVRDTSGRIWIGTQNGVNIYDQRTNQFVVPWEEKTQNIFKNNRVYSAIVDHDGIIWFATRYGLHYMENDSLKSLNYAYNKENSISSNWVYRVYEDIDNHIWIGTKDGLDRYDKQTKTFIHYKRGADNCTNCISNNEVLSIYQDEINGDIWIGTVSGLNRFNKETEIFEIYTENDGLPNNMIYDILGDHHGNLWISTNRGLSQFNYETKQFTNFSITDGLQNYEFNLGSSFKSESGEFFFGGISGLNAFFPDSIQKNMAIPKVVITSLELINNKNKIIYRIDGHNEIEIPYRNTMITLEFASLDFTDPDKNLYAYKLENVEDEWIEVGKRRFASFSSLPPGKYTFKVKGSNSDFIWNDEGASLNINVVTPFWRSTFSYLFYTLIGVGSIYFFFQYRTRSLRESNQKLKEKEEIAKQVAKQKEELTIKNKNITDSILYAKRIQESLLPSSNLFFRALPNSFILHKPKDIVSGDFYWVNEKDNKIFIAVVDCTGHGVPGAFMSIIGFELLRKITDDLGIDEPDKILDELNNGVALTFRKDSNNVRLKDGMDIALCVIDKKRKVMDYAGAFRPLYFMRDNKIEEVKGDRFSVGLLEENEVDLITKTSIQLKKDDIFYLFTDGYADQFGGPEEKKFKYRRFRHLLLTIHKLPFEQQKLYLDKSIEDWKGELEQVDDILIVGFKPEWE